MAAAKQCWLLLRALIDRASFDRATAHLAIVIIMHVGLCMRRRAALDVVRRVCILPERNADSPCPLEMLVADRVLVVVANTACAAVATARTCVVVGGVLNCCALLVGVCALPTHPQSMFE